MTFRFPGSVYREKFNSNWAFSLGQADCLLLGKRVTVEGKEGLGGIIQPPGALSDPPH